jgi:hypothetical protein
MADSSFERPPSRHFTALETHLAKLVGDRTISIGHDMLPPHDSGGEPAELGPRHPAPDIGHVALRLSSANKNKLLAAA